MSGRGISRGRAVKLKLNSDNISALVAGIPGEGGGGSSAGSGRGGSPGSSTATLRDLTLDEDDDVILPYDGGFDPNHGRSGNGRSGTNGNGDDDWAEWGLCKPPILSELDPEDLDADPFHTLLQHNVKFAPETPDQELIASETTIQTDATTIITKIPEMPKKSCCGLRMEMVRDIAQSLTQIREAGYDYVCANIVYDDILNNNMKFGIGSLNEPFSWSDMAISTSEWGSGVVGILAKLEEHLEGEDTVLMKRAEDALFQQMNYAQHLGLPAILIELDRMDSAHLARIILAKLVQPHCLTTFWLKIPMGHFTNYAYEPANDDVLRMREQPWLCWHNFRALCNYEKKLVPVLELQADVPDDKEIDRWLGEPVKAVFISPDIFTTNQKGFPVLSRPHQSVVRKFFGIGAQVVIDSCGFSEDLKYYRQYIDYLWNNLHEEENSDEILNTFSRGYEDYLQCPLQPLMDNLESQTYEVFEKDPIKYDLYEEAIYEALLSKKDDKTQEGKPAEVIVIMVVGAGRGPLVQASLTAAEKAVVQVRIYAVEKNGNAVNTLRHLDGTTWKNKGVNIVFTDMRCWKAPEQADIMISELLGSFGDNELSPECLDGAQSFLKDDGIMIPKSYTSFIAPIMSTKLFSEVRSHRDPDRGPLVHYETPYVVHMHNKYMIAEPQPLFVFAHPVYNPDQVRPNDRYGTRLFKVEQDCVFHGFAGYFESRLFGDVMMSTHPATHSPGMFSWFPMYFPVREPYLLKGPCTMKAHFWRRASNANVWYEWSISNPISVPIHNSQGKSYNIGLTV